MRVQMTYHLQRLAVQWLEGLRFAEYWKCKLRVRRGHKTDRVNENSIKSIDSFHILTITLIPATMVACLSVALSVILYGGLAT